MDNPFEPELLIEERGAVRIVTLNRPDAMNATNAALHDALVSVWKHLAADPGARAVVITGAGKAFSAGGDMHHLQANQRDRVLRQHELDQAGELVRQMSACPLPVVAAVNGPAIGLGANLAVLSDIVLISDKAHIADPHVGIGLTAADGGAPSWPLFMSLLKAKEYLFTGDRILPAMAVELGLANRVVPAADLMEEAVALAERLARQPQQALRSTKQALNLHLTRAISGVLEFALAEEFKSFDEPEHVTLVQGFIDRAAAKA